MSIQGIQAISAFNDLSPSTGSFSLSQTESSSANFTDLVLNKLQKTSESIETSSNLFEMYLKGDAVSVHEVMIAMGKAKSELQLAVEIRNKILDAYQEITRIQI